MNKETTMGAEKPSEKSRFLANSIVGTFLCWAATAIAHAIGPVWSPRLPLLPLTPAQIGIILSLASMIIALCAFIYLTRLRTRTMLMIATPWLALIYLVVDTTPFLPTKTLNLIILTTLAVCYIKRPDVRSRRKNSKRGCEARWQ